MRIAGYVRVSTDEQAEQGYSIEEQVETIHKWCRDNGHSKPEMYIDDGYSAKDLRRPSIKRLLDDVKDKKYDMVITTKLNRLSRKLYDILSLIEYFEKYNCSYASVRESFDTSTYVGRMQMQMLGMIAEFDRERIAEDVRNTMRSIARRSGDSKKAFTVPCYGYDVKDGIYVINVEEALVIQQMADMILSGLSCRLVAKTLNDKGIKSKQGTTWSDLTVKQLMRRETLKGQLIYNRTYKKNRKTITRPPEEWIVIDDHHPAILEEQTWNDVQRVLDARKGTNRHADNKKWLLTGLLKCGHCGYNFKGKTLTKKKKPDYALHKYICGQYQSRGGCFHHAVNRDEIEQLVIEAIKKVATDPQPHKLQLIVSEPKTVEAEKDALLQRLKKLDQKMQKQIEAYEEDLISAADLKRARERIDEERRAIEKQLEELGSNDNQFTNREVQKNAKRYLDEILSSDRLVVKNAIRKIVKTITVMNGEEVQIKYHL